MPQNGQNWLNNLRFGAEFQHYTLLERIGTGGQGVVWSAIDHQHNGVVALKLNAVPEDNDDFRTDDWVLARQAEKLLPLRHPHILPMLDIGLTQGVRYIASPYLTGGSLAEKIASGPLPIHETLAYARQVASALEYLHAQGVIHRDLKPANVLLDAQNNAYITDFGLARFVADSTQALHTGRGTPPYSSPEQHGMNEMTIGSDIYSFGVMLYEMFTGQLPWNGEKTLGILQLYTDQPIPDPCEVNSELPTALAGILRQMTSRDVANRPASAIQALQELHHVFDIPYIPTPDLPSNEAHALLEKNLPAWEPSEGTVRLNLTGFALVNLTVEASPKDEKYARFMLQNALAHNLDIAQWWERVQPVAARLDTALGLLSHDNKPLTRRVLEHLLADPEVRARPNFQLPEHAKAFLLDLLTADDTETSLRQAVLDTLLLLTPRAERWQPLSLDAPADELLASLSIEESRLGNTAAQLIGHLRSEHSIQTLLRRASADELSPTLMEIQAEAGSLPGMVPLALRLAVTGEVTARRIRANRAGLFAAYIGIAGGSFMGIGGQIFIHYPLPAAMLLTRISIAFEHGLFAAITLGVSLLLVRATVELFPETPTTGRLGIASLLGGLALYGSLAFYDILFLENPPSGMLLPLGSTLIAVGFALAGLWHRPVWKMLTSFIFTFSALALTWWAHITLADSPFDYTPIFFYEYAWEAWAVLGVMLVASLPVAILGQAVSLNPVRPPS